MKKSIIITSTLLVLSAFLFHACDKKGSAQAGKEQPGAEAEKSETREILPDTIVELNVAQIKAAGIAFGMVEEKPLGVIIKASGVVSVPPGNRATVCTPWGGFVKNILLLPGSNIRKGQVLAVIENPEFIDIQQRYLEAASRLEFAEADFNRHTQLHSDDVYSTQNLQQVTADFKPENPGKRPFKKAASSRH